MAATYREALAGDEYSNDNIRNVCILAHVDHGKTTIADHLLTVNMIITKRMAGVVKLLDDREDEQTRGITMKSSPVSLIWERPEKSTSAILVNFIDTPGHVDFSTEVAAAVRLCDGAFIVVDVIEGVCVQTKEAIKQAFEEGVTMVLLLNKFDKLIVELNKGVGEIFNYVIRVIENCNAYIADLIRAECAATGEDLEDDKYFFSPDSGNVVFCSALHGWGFTLRDIARLFLGKIEGEDEDSLTKKMWDFDNYIDGKTKQIRKGAIKKVKENLFVQMCLKTIHYIYTTIVVRMDSSKINDIALQLKVEKVTQAMRHPDPKSQIKAIMQAWSPLSHTMMQVCDKLICSPKNISDRKVKYLTSINLPDSSHLAESKQNLYNCLITCSTSDDATVIIYISKMFCVDRRRITNTPTEEESDIETLLQERNLAIIALGRVFSGILRKDQEVYFLSPNYNPEHLQNTTEETFTSNNYIRKVPIKELFVLYGRDFIPAKSVKAGNICGIGNLQDFSFRKGTLTSDFQHVPFVEREILEPIVRTTIEPAHVSDYAVLRASLRLLMQTDSCVQVKMQETGDLVLVTAGDVHLAKCLEDLKKFTDVEVKLSEPMVSLRETVSVEVGNEESKACSMVSSDPKVSLTVEVVSLPRNIAALVRSHYELLHMIEDHGSVSGIDIVLKRKQSEANRSTAVLKTFKEPTQNAVRNIHALLKRTMNEIFENIWSVGLSKENINILCGNTAYNHSLFYTLDESDSRSCFVPYIINTFKNFCKAGSICGEPLLNCAFLVREFSVLEFDNEMAPQMTVNFENFVKNVLQEGFLNNGPRLMEPIFTTDIEVNTKILGEFLDCSFLYVGITEANDSEEIEKSHR